MGLIDIAFAFYAGIAAFLSPCSFPLLPAYISYYLGLKGPSSGKGQATFVLQKGILGGIVCAIGAILVLATIGIGVSAFGGAIEPHVPKMEPIVGVILVIMGALMFSATPFGFRIKIKASARRGYIGLFGFGILYALATAGCVAPIFIGVIARAVSSGFFGGMAIFLSYALGLGLLLVIVTIFIASARDLMIAKLTRAMPYVERVGALILIIVGVYLIWYYFITFS
jgi:cytochrome c-type biogenesis protein